LIETVLLAAAAARSSAVGPPGVPGLTGYVTFRRRTG
jgi:hypothetical protein